MRAAGARIVALRVVGERLANAGRGSGSPVARTALSVALGSTRLSIGHASRAATGKVNEDAAGVADPLDPRVAERGFAVAVADGVGTDGGGRVAAQAAVQAAVTDFYATPAAWSVPQALDRVVGAINEWLHAQNSRRVDDDGAVATLTSLLFREDRWRLAHVGDCRAYRLRDGRWQQLTADHVWPRHDMRHVVKRAIGLDTHLVVDSAEASLHGGDRFLIASDGVWEVLGDHALRDAVVRADDPQAAADALVAQAVERQGLYMGRNDATAVVVRVDR